MKLPGLNGLSGIGLVGERKAVSLLALGFFTTYFFLLTMLARTELPEYVPMFAGLLAVYVVAFMGVAAEWFWGRWFAIGLGYWGISMAIMAFVTTRSLPTPILIFGVAHALIALFLQGEKMAAVFDAKPQWRERWKLDEQGVLRVRKSVTRAASSLPALILFALAPREGAGLYAAPWYDFWAILLLGLAIAALFGLLTSRRTWTILSLAALGVAALWVAFTSHSLVWGSSVYLDRLELMPQTSHYLVGAFGGIALIVAATPFLGPIASFVFRGRRA
jgi:hypothetical protein